LTFHLRKVRRAYFNGFLRTIRPIWLNFRDSYLDIRVTGIALRNLHGLPACTDRSEFWKIDGGAIRWIGAVLFAVGGTPRIWPAMFLGIVSAIWLQFNPGVLWFFMESMASSGTLVTWGYSSTRSGGVSLFDSGSESRSPHSLFLRSLAGIDAEEKLLKAQFGTEYDAYCARTSRLIPGLLFRDDRLPTESKYQRDARLASRNL